MITIGVKGKESLTVTQQQSAKTMGSGTLDVLATPAMIALMEQTAWKSIVPYLDSKQSSVGTRLDITHDAPTPLGMTVTCESELVEIDGRRLVFTVTASDDKGIIGKGIHERFLIQEDTFQEKAMKKMNS